MAAENLTSGPESLDVLSVVEETVPAIPLQPDGQRLVDVLVVEIVPEQRQLSEADAEKVEKERELLKRFHTGDISALEGIFKMYAPMIKRDVGRKLDEETAADICQETFLRYMLNMDRVKDRGAGIAPWLRVVARNLTMDELARRTKGPISKDMTEELFTDMAPLISTDNTEERALGQIALREVVQALVKFQSEAQREAVVKIYLEGMSIAEYAAEKGEAVDAVKQRLHRARAHLRPLRQRWQSLNETPSPESD